MVSGAMGDLRKITAFIPADLMEGSLKITGEGVSETLREALRQMNHAWACRELLNMTGMIDLEAESGVTLAELREDKSYDRADLEP